MTAPLRATALPINWYHYDRGALREMVAVCAEEGFTHIDICPPWPLLQPSAAQVDRTTMQHLEQIVDLAQSAGLCSQVQLLSVRAAGELVLPDWHHGPDAVGFLAGRTRQPVRAHGTPVRINGQLRPLNLADPYSTESWRTAQNLLLRTVVGYFGSHPGITHWHLGDGWSRLADTTPAVANAWLTAVTQITRTLAPKALVVATVDAPNLLGHALSVATLAAQVDLLQVDAAMPEIPRRTQLRLSGPAIVLHDVVAALAQKPVVVRLTPTSSGPARAWLQQTWHQQSLAIAQLTDEDGERYAQAVIGGLRAAGCAGVVVPLALPTGSPDTVRQSLGALARGWTECGALQVSTDAERFLHDPLRGFQMLWKDVCTAV